MDDIPQWPGFRAAGFFDDVPNGDNLFELPVEVQSGLGFETADAQHIVAALDRLTEQQRVANLITYRGTIPGSSTRIRVINDEIEKGLGL
jgi:hypothetical protein